MQTSVTPAVATSSASATATPAMTLHALADAYMAAYEGRDRTRPVTLGFWCDRFGERVFASLTDDDVAEGLDVLRARPARVRADRWATTSGSARFQRRRARVHAWQARCVRAGTTSARRGGHGPRSVGEGVNASVGDLSPRWKV